jgi:hypothetical protein
VIACALRATLLGGRALWDRFDNGDNLLFKAATFGDFEVLDDEEDRRAAARRAEKKAKKPFKPAKVEKAKATSRLPYFIGGGVAAALSLVGIIIVASGGKKEKSNQQPSAPEVAKAEPKNTPTSPKVNVPPKKETISDAKVNNPPPKIDVEPTPKKDHANPPPAAVTNSANTISNRRFIR